MLLTEAENLAPLGPWHVMSLGHGLDPSPIVKKNRLSTVWGTLAGNLAVAKLRNFLVKLVTKPVALGLTGGRVGLRRGSLF